MNEKNQSVINFQIDDTPTPEQALESFLDEYELDFQSFIERTIDDEKVAQAFSYSNKAVKKAGRRLRKKEGDLKSATAIIQQFRAAHEKPLKTIAYLIGRTCREAGFNVKPVMRLKRLDTIIDKLQRKSLDGTTDNATCVTNMNDIGGCRVIFPTSTSLKKVHALLQETVEKGDKIRIKDIDDYISQPKANDCGYRSLHVIYRYQHEESGKSFNIEAQLRTMLQHIWATTVEIIDILERTKIKTHSHSPNEYKDEKQIKWEELLSIMSRYIAGLEEEHEFTCEEQQKDAESLTQLNDELNALVLLKSFNLMSKEVVTCSNDKISHVLLIIDENTQKRVFRHDFNEYSSAISVYNEIEKIAQGYQGLNAILVSTKNMSQLSEAYPNYLGDCASFVELLENAMNCA